MRSPISTPSIWHRLEALDDSEFKWAVSRVANSPNEKERNADGFPLIWTESISQKKCNPSTEHGNSRMSCHRSADTNPCRKNVRPPLVPTRLLSLRRAG